MEKRPKKKCGKEWGKRREAYGRWEKKHDHEERARLTSREEGTVRPPWKLERLKVRQGGRISGQAAWVSNFLHLIPSLKLDDSSSFNSGTPTASGLKQSLAQNTAVTSNNTQRILVTLRDIIGKGPTISLMISVVTEQKGQLQVNAGGCHTATPSLLIMRFTLTSPCS